MGKAAVAKRSTVPPKMWGRLLSNTVDWDSERGSVEMGLHDGVDVDHATKQQLLLSWTPYDPLW